MNIRFDTSENETSKINFNVINLNCKGRKTFGFASTELASVLAPPWRTLRLAALVDGEAEEVAVRDAGDFDRVLECEEHALTPPRM